MDNYRFPKIQITADLRQLLTLIMFVVASCLQQISAQQIHPVIILEADGKISCKIEKGKSLALKPGTAFYPPADISMTDNSRLVYLENNQFKILNGTNNIQLKAEPAGPGISTLNFDPVFAEYLKASLATTNNGAVNNEFRIKNLKKLGTGWGVGDGNKNKGWGVQDPAKNKGWGVDDPAKNKGWGVQDPGGNKGWGVKDPKKTGGWGVQDPTKAKGWGVDDPAKNKGWGVDDPAKNKGWGVQDMNIDITTPGGIYPATKVPLSWVPVKGVKEYLVCIFDENLAIIDKATTNTNSVTMDLSNLKPEKSYYWQVFAGNKRSISMPVTFSLLTKEDFDFNKNAASDSQIYDKVSVTVKGLMDAVAYENNKMYADAQNKYEKLMAAYPQNNLVRINYLAFCLRMGQTNKAKKIGKGIR